MNYASVIFVFVMACSLFYYYFRARHWFQGPGRSLQPDLDPDMIDDSITEGSKTSSFLNVQKRPVTGSSLK